jgi:DNA-binding response OmpR family regulator
MVSKKVLIIDDDPDILEITSMILSTEGYDVESSLNGKPAMDLINEQQFPDLLLLDVRLVGEEKNGNEICNALKANDKTKNIPVVLISAEQDLVNIAYQCGADGYIKKPFDINFMVEKVKEFINISRGPLPGGIQIDNLNISA